MAYINLHQISELTAEALLLKHMVDCQCYNMDPKKSRLADNQFVEIIKTYKQADNLLTKLRKMHQVCTDFVAGNFGPYVTEFDKGKEAHTDVFDAWDELERCFNTFSVDDLPERIEQYRELLIFSRSFADMQKVKREGLNQFFGNIPRYYQAVDDQGESVMIPETEMSADFLNQRAAQAEIADIEIDYCLDKYNEFYQIAAGVYGSYAGASDDVTPCAEAILSLFSPYAAAKQK